MGGENGSGRRAHGVRHTRWCKAIGELSLCVCLVTNAAVAGATLDDRGETSAPFGFRAYLEHPPTLVLGEPAIDGASVTVSGSDSRCPSTPFTFDWGDGSREETFLPASHEFVDVERDYTVTVTAHYDPGESSASVLVRFGPPRADFRRDPSIPECVHVAREPVPLGTTWPGYSAPEGLRGFAEEDLAVPRTTWEYLLDVGHELQLDFGNRDVTEIGGSTMVVLGAPGFGGAFSLWFTEPVAMGANPSYLASLSGISSLYHEMGHDLTLNGPAHLRLGGNTDGRASTVVSETLAQIFQHATAWELLNHPTRYGLGETLAEEVRRSALASFAITAHAYRDYVARGCPFATLQVAGDDADRTFGTFMTLAYVFVENAEVVGAYRAPLKRMMRLLQTFGERDRERYQMPENDAFRATFVVAALSHAFGRDLRGRFRELRFALDDEVYVELRERVEGA